MSNQFSLRLRANFYLEQYLKIINNKFQIEVLFVYNNTS